MLAEIDDHCENKGRYGFTIPFLYSIEKENGRKKTIKEILYFLSQQTKEYFISNCQDLDELIIGLHKDEYPPVHMWKAFGNLHFDEDVIGNFDSLDELVIFIETDYQKIIDSGKYSKNIETNKWE